MFDNALCRVRSTDSAAGCRENLLGALALVLSSLQKVQTGRRKAGKNSSEVSTYE